VACVVFLIALLFERPVRSGLLMFADIGEPTGEACDEV
jgi:hypothetical protein